MVDFAGTPLPSPGVGWENVTGEQILDDIKAYKAKLEAAWQQPQVFKGEWSNEEAWSKELSAAQVAKIKEEWSKELSVKPGSYITAPQEGQVLMSGTLGSMWQPLGYATTATWIDSSPSAPGWKATVEPTVEWGNDCEYPLPGGEKDWTPVEYTCQNCGSVLNVHMKVTMVKEEPDLASEDFLVSDEICVKSYEVPKVKITLLGSMQHLC